MKKIDEKNWAAFNVESLFDEIKATKGKTTGQLIKGDDVPYIAAAKTNNGCVVVHESSYSTTEKQVWLSVQIQRRTHGKYQNHASGYRRWYS